MPFPDIETAKIITLSTGHLHPGTIRSITAQKGEIDEGPSIALRDEGLLVNSELGDDGVLTRDLQSGLFPSLNIRFPDLVTVRAIARGLGAEWVNFDADGVEYCDILPLYNENGFSELPSDPDWKSAFEASNAAYVLTAASALSLSREILEQIEAGQTPGLDSNDIPQP